jgi:peptidyl-prolyl cis-trans isomerase A (cyclophilin A)
VRRALPLLLALAAACGGSAGGPYLVLETSMGRMVARLDERAAPRTVARLRELCGRPKPFYDGLLFHRVVPGHYIQTGDHTGTGFGDPKLPLPDEIAPAAKFDRAGILGMASWGPGTSQTQFFVTLSPQPDLDGLHTRFGELVEGLEVAERISRVPRDEKSGSDRPHDPPVLKSLRIVPSRP